MSSHKQQTKHGKRLGNNEGEGSRSADKAYTAGVQEFIEEDRVSKAAVEAKEFVEENPTQAERDEMAGKAGPTPIAHRIEELATEGKAMFHRAVERVRSVIHKRAAR